jgi:hypothetical protein
MPATDGGESPDAAAKPVGAVGLSYASPAAGAAQRICEALRAGGTRSSLEHDPRCTTFLRKTNLPE